MNRINRFLMGLIIFTAILTTVCSYFTTANAENSKPKFDHVDLVLIVDKSGSMNGMESDTIGGFNSMLDKQRKMDVATDVTTVMFNNTHEFIHERKRLSEIKNLNDVDYRPGGATALLDAVGLTVDKVTEYYQVDEPRNKVIVAIITDGLENASQKYNKQLIKKLISAKKEEGWEFIFLGANIDAVAEADSIGITSDRVVQYKQTNEGVRKNFDAISSFANEAISAEGVTNAWKDKAEQDKK